MINPLFVLDTSAFLALVHRESGYQQVTQRIMDAASVMSSVNVAEVLAKQADIGVPAAEALSLLNLIGIRIESFGSRDAMLAGSLRPATRPFGLSLGDRACLALGLHLKCPVLTADLVWSELDIGVEVVQIR